MGPTHTQGERITPEHKEQRTGIDHGGGLRICYSKWECKLIQPLPENQQFLTKLNMYPQ